MNDYQAPTDKISQMIADADNNENNTNPLMVIHFVFAFFFIIPALCYIIYDLGLTFFIIKLIFSVISFIAAIKLFKCFGECVKTNLLKIL
jgi:hypothetical protein